MALTQGRNTPERAGKTLVLPVKGATIIYDGAFVAVDADGYAVPGKKATGLTAAGRAEEYVNNLAGADGDQSVLVRRGVFRWSNAGTVTAKDTLKTCYMVDDETVTTTATGSSIAGKILGLEDGDVIVETL